MLSCIQLFANSWTLAHQVPLSMQLSQQEYWSGLPFPPPGDLPKPGIESTSPGSPALQEDSLLLSHQQWYYLLSTCNRSNAVLMTCNKFPMYFSQSPHQLDIYFHHFLEGKSETLRNKRQVQVHPDNKCEDSTVESTGVGRKRLQPAGVSILGKRNRDDRWGGDGCKNRVQRELPFEELGFDQLSCVSP